MSHSGDTLCDIAMVIVRLVCLGLLGLLGACGQIRPLPPQGCVLPAYQLTLGRVEDAVAAPAKSAPSSPPPETPAASAEPTGNSLLAQAMQTRIETSEDYQTGKIAPRRRVAMLSGGSQHGAFGAGFFYGLARANALPAFDVVTGVSTGGLQSTFVFLANRPVPGGRTYAPYIRPDPVLGLPGQSNLGDLALAYAPRNESDLLALRSTSAVIDYADAVRDGSLATFRPLREMLTGLISEGTIRAVASEATVHGRSLLVAVTDVDDGFGYAIDLTQLAQDAVATNTVGAAQHCYVEALIASSSVPPGVPPVSLTFRTTTTGTHTDLFIDGGARFGVFFEQVRKLGQVDQHGAAVPTDVLMLVNGYLYEAPWTDSTGHRPATWSLLTLGLRSVDTLENQVYRLTVHQEQVWAATHGTLQFAFISNTGLHTLKTDPDAWGYNGQSCRDAARQDEASKPYEFHPRYMRCLIDYGQHRAMIDPWNWTIGRAAQ